MHQLGGILLRVEMAKYNITDKKIKEAAYRTLVSPQLMDDLKEKIINALLIKKMYKDKGYSAKRLAMDLCTNTRYISAVLNVRFHTNYAALVNSYRIEEAMALLADKRYQDLNIEDISYMVGFSNRQSFYAAFYKINGCTPRTYKLRYLPQRRVTDKKSTKRKRESEK